MLTSLFASSLGVTTTIVTTVSSDDYLGLPGAPGLRFMSLLYWLVPKNLLINYTQFISWVSVTHSGKERVYKWHHNCNHRMRRKAQQMPHCRIAMASQICMPYSAPSAVDVLKHVHDHVLVKPIQNACTMISILALGKALLLF